MKHFLKKGCRLKSVSIDRSSDLRNPTVTAFDGQGKIPGVQTFLTVDSDVGRGVGVARLVQQGGTLKVFTLFTSMTELKGHEEAVFGRRPEGVAHGGLPGRKNWQEQRTAEENCNDFDPAVLILGTSLVNDLRSSAHRCRCWSSWIKLSSSSQDARYQDSHHRPERTYWGQLASKIPPACTS